MAACFGVSAPAFIACGVRPRLRHAIADTALLKQIRTVARDITTETMVPADPRVHAALKQEERTRRNANRPLMRAAGRFGAHRRAPGDDHTRAGIRPAPVWSDRTCVAARPNQALGAESPS